MLFYRHILTTICRTSCWTWAPARVVWCWRPLWLAPFCALEVTPPGGVTLPSKNGLFFYEEQWGKNGLQLCILETLPSYMDCFTRENGETCSSPMYFYFGIEAIYEWFWVVQPGKMLIQWGCSEKYCDLGKNN